MKNSYLMRLFKTEKLQRFRHFFFTSSKCINGYNFVKNYLVICLEVWGFQLRIHLQFRRHKKQGFDPWVGKIPWSRKWQPTVVFLPEKFHGQRSWQATVLGFSKGQNDRAHTYTHAFNPVVKLLRCYHGSDVKWYTPKSN